MTYKELLTNLYQQGIRQPQSDEIWGEFINLNISINPLEKFLIDHTNWDYVRDELIWYNSMSLNINDCPRIAHNPIWRDTVATKEGLINSNYGWCIYSKENGSQYQHCLEKLKAKQGTKQAVMIYGRPSLQTEWNDNIHAQHDFMCTMYVSVQIRNNIMNYIIHQRSSDVINGFRNDIQWHANVMSNLGRDLNLQGSLFLGKYQMWGNFDTIHLYSRDAEKVKGWLNE